MVAGQRPQAEASGRTIRVDTAVDMIWRDLISTNGKGANATLLEPPVSHTSSNSTPRSRESESFEVVSLYEPPAVRTYTYNYYQLQNPERVWVKALRR